MSRNNNGIWKYCYWLDDQGLSELKQEMADQGTPIVRAEQNPCEALKGEIGYAEPTTWSTICKHDAAPWYRASKHNGKNLIVSSFPLKGSSLTWPRIKPTVPVILRVGGNFLRRWVMLL